MLMSRMSQACFGDLRRQVACTGLKLTLGTYGDHDELLRRQAQAVESMVRWIEAQQKARSAASG